MTATASADAAIGQRIEDLDTPTLYVDFDALDHNIALMARRAAEAGVVWRPHVKASKAPDLAKRILAGGAHGITCAKVGEAEAMVAAAEAMVAAGVDDMWPGCVHGHGLRLHHHHERPGGASQATDSVHRRRGGGPA